MEIIVSKKNEATLDVGCEIGIRQELTEFFSFFVDGYKYMPSYRNKMWDGKIRIFNGRTSELPVGLYEHLKVFAKDRNYKIKTQKTTFGLPDDSNKINPKDLMTFIDTLNLANDSGEIKIRDYQASAVWAALSKMRMLIQSPTGSGKSLILYILSRMLIKLYPDKKILVIVPTTGLVDQLYSDFESYAKNDPRFDTSVECHKIYGGKEKTSKSARVIISTWQSIYKMPTSFFKDFFTVLGDEAHGYTAKSCTSIMKKCYNAKYRIGTTGTIDDNHVHRLVLQGMFGKIVKMISTAELQKSGTLAELDIDIIKLKYPKSIRENFVNIDYHKELDFIVTNEKRNNLIKNLAINLTGNTLILFNFVDKHGKILHKMISESLPKDRKSYYVSGEVSTAERESIRKLIETQKNSITCASVVFATGTNIVNIHNIILVSPSKGMIRLLQSIGRGLRKTKDNRRTRLIDIIDILHPEGQPKNYTYTHGLKRIKIYKDEKFNFKIRELNIE